MPQLLAQGGSLSLARDQLSAANQPAAVPLTAGPTAAGALAAATALRRRAEAIVGTFLSAGAEQQINVPSKVRLRCEAAARAAPFAAPQGTSVAALPASLADLGPGATGAPFRAPGDNAKLAAPGDVFGEAQRECARLVINNELEEIFGSDAAQVSNAEFHL